MPLSPVNPDSSALNVLIATDSLSPPLTGIGYYTAQLLNELIDSPAINHLEGLGPTGILSCAALKQQLSTLGIGDDIQTGNAAEQQAPAAPMRASLLRRSLRQVPILARSARAMYRAWNQYQLSKRRGVLLHAPNYIPPGNHAGPTVLTVHDLSHLRYPETHPKERLQWLARHLPNALAKAAHIICVSEFTRNELISLGLVKDQSKTSVVYNGLEAGFCPRAEEGVIDTLDRWKLGYRGYLLSVSTLEPRKNLSRLLDAYQALPEEIRSKTPLVLAGSGGWKNKELHEQIARIKAPGRVVLTGYVDRLTLQQLYSGAALFAYLSIYEGFGLPVVEAMASGTPVITANSSALAEVAANAALTVDPENTDAILEGIRNLLGNHTLTEQYRQLGLSRAADFSWQRCAE